MNNKRSLVGRNTATIEMSCKTKALIALGESQGWEFPVLGIAPMPHHTVHINNWMIVPAHLDKTPLPPMALDRMNAIFESGLSPKGWVIVHEAPKLLPSNVEPNEQQNTVWISPQTRQRAKQLMKVSGGILGAIALGTGALTLAIAAIALFLPATLIAGAIILDPILIAVMEDGCWVEIFRWES
jgi:hypothetical protein